MTSYFDTDDKQYTRIYKSETPDILSSFNDFNAAVFAAENREIPLKYRELIAVAVAITTQCAYCIDGHSANAVKAGASRGELAEAAWVAAALKAGGAFAHGRLALKLTDGQFEDAEAAHQHTVEPVH
jgi:AhpD family alkylhydroperoxidase